MDKVTVKIKLDTDSSGVTSATIDVNELDKAVESVVKSVNKAKVLHNTHSQSYKP